MGVVPRQVGEQFLITSDRAADGVTARRAPPRLQETFQVWTGRGWSTTVGDAQAFVTLDEAEDYLRSHFAQIMA